jgi:hypothetical protein
MDILTSCPTYFGRMNEIAEPYDMVHYLRDTSAPMQDLQDCTCSVTDSDEESSDAHPWPLGVFRDEIRADYGSLYQEKIAACVARGARK